uniref:Uncharacterized protein n=1 Tax=Magallana gigas TaxID=29159 RepID=K1PTZ2_MAGGI
MVCQELLSSPRLEGVRVFVIARVLTKQLNIRAYDIEKVMEQFSDLQCDQILPRPGTKVFFGDRLCTHVSTDRRKRYPSTTTSMMETAAIGFRFERTLRVLESKNSEEETIIDVRLFADDQPTEKGQVMTLSRWRILCDNVEQIEQNWKK